jgi:hypothetical protein
MNRINSNYTRQIINWGTCIMAKIYQSVCKCAPLIEIIIPFTSSSIQGILCSHLRASRKFHTAQSEESDTPPIHLVSGDLECQQNRHTCNWTNHKRNSPRTSQMLQVLAAVLVDRRMFSPKPSIDLIIIGGGGGSADACYREWRGNWC